MEKNSIKGKSGVALIMVLVMVIIFSSLILAVVISSTTAIRRAHFFKDKTVALQVAEAGLQDAFFWLNHKGYDSQDYPGNDQYFRGSAYTGTDTWIDSEEKFNPTGMDQAECVLRISTTGTDNGDTLTSTGTYRGRSATVSVKIRGANTPGTELKGAYQGVAEAFNKKAVYAADVELGAATITGNVTTLTARPGIMPGSQATWTETGISIPWFKTTTGFELPGEPGSFDEVYSETGYVYRNPAYIPGSGEVNSLDDGVYWETGLYVFGRNNTNGAAEPFSAQGNVRVMASNLSIPANGGTVSIGHYLKVEGGDISIQRSITTSNSGACAMDVADGNTVTISPGITVTGDLVVRNAPVSLSNNIVSGSVVTNRDLALSGGNIIDASSSPYGAALMITYKTTGKPDDLSSETKILDINPTPAVTLGTNQKTAAFLSFQNGIINVNGNFLPSYNNPGQSCIVNYSGAASQVNIGLTSISNIRGSIYSYKDIQLDNHTHDITGILVAGEKATLNAGHIIYDPDPYLEYPAVYDNFGYGRRKYLPVPGSWEIRW